MIEDVDILFTLLSKKKKTTWEANYPQRMLMSFPGIKNWNILTKIQSNIE